MRKIILSVAIVFLGMTFSINALSQSNSNAYYYCVHVRGGSYIFRSCPNGSFSESNCFEMANGGYKPYGFASPTPIYIQALDYKATPGWSTVGYSTPSANKYTTLTTYGIWPGSAHVKLDFEKRAFQNCCPDCHV